MNVETLDEAGDPRATLAAVAKEANVSVSTVSKVLNGRAGVSDATRSLVERLLSDHGYNRRGGDRSAPLIELVFSALTTDWAFEVIKGVEPVARENGMSVVLTQSGNRRSPGPEWIDGVLRRRPVGVILMFSGLSEENKRQLRTRNIPFVVVDPAGDPAPDVPSVGSANWSGGVLATRHLIEFGHTRIGMITGPDDMMCSRARVAGYRSALEAAGLPLLSELVVPGQFRRSDGVEGGSALLSLDDPVTAIFAGNDQQALGVYQIARERGIRVPEDLSVVGFDGLQMAEWVVPQLTTIQQPIGEMAEQAARLVIRLHDGDQTDSLRVELATSLVVRGSTAPARSRGSLTPTLATTS